jgi:hypothetical protein
MFTQLHQRQDTVPPIGRLLTYNHARAVSRGLAGNHSRTVARALTSNHSRAVATGRA